MRFCILLTSLAFTACGSSGSSAWVKEVPPTQMALSDVWASSAQDVWVTGTAGTVLHFNGTDWAEISTGSQDYPRGIWGFGPDDIWVAAGEDVLHYNGSEWSQELPDNFSINGLKSIWGSSTSDIWVISEIDARFLHYIGSSWTWANISSVFNSGIWGAASDDIWIVGNDLVHYNGQDWIESDEFFHFEGVFGTASNDVWAVGDNDGPVHWDGESWTPYEIDYLPDLLDVWCLSSESCWAVGGYGLIMRWDGRKWREVQSGTQAGLTGVFGVSSGEAWAVGMSYEDASGVLLHLPAPAD